MPDDEWQLGHYTISDELGPGGMGVVHRARQEHSGRIVALKGVLGTGGFEAYYHCLTAIYLRDFAEAKTAITGTANIPDHTRGPFCPPVWFEAMLSRAASRRRSARRFHCRARMDARRLG
ncbi:MAG: hypothetical protein M3032_12170 [Verrucomicrobiota bacterium]|nr:hypothetical protein [Verrucomicrobiota bacterium]